MRGRSTFNRQEADEIRALLAEKCRDAPSKQKAIRQRLRDIGFHIRDFRTGGAAFSPKDFDALVREGTIQIVDDEPRPEHYGGPPVSKVANHRDDSDEAYVIALCDEILGTKAKRQHSFDFLRGDAGTPLRVDAWYESLSLVVEYRERQHTEAVPFFDKRQTVSGVGRAEQRRIYDERRRVALPANGVDLIEIGFQELQHTSNGRLGRAPSEDMVVIRARLGRFSDAHGARPRP